MSSTGTQPDSSYLVRKNHSLFAVIHNKQKGTYIP
jgi:hypothetical protein